MSTATVVHAFLDRVLSDRLDARGTDFTARALAELARGVPSERFGELLSLASRHATRRAIEWHEGELAAGRALAADFDPQCWSVLDVLRVRLVLALDGLAGEAGERALLDAFKFADEGETCALLRSLVFVPAPERFLWRATEGCRSNMRSVFEAVATDSPFPVQHFDDVAWRQALLKSVFVGAPTWRIRGLDRRRDLDLARMTLDYIDERRSAGRPVPPAVWALVEGPLDARALHSVEAEIAVGPEVGRAGAYLALARAGRPDLLDAHLRTEIGALAGSVGRAALTGRTDQSAFERLAGT